MAPGSKQYLYEKVRKPSRKVSDDDILSIWCRDPKNKNLSLDTGKKAQAPKANKIFEYLRSAILDPKQTHLRAVLYEMVKRYKDADKVLESMLSSLQSEPPTLSLFKFTQDDSAMGFTDVLLKERIFICDKLSSALEQSDSDSPLETQLKFLVFNTLWHELAHWLHYDPEYREFSGQFQRWKDFAGENVSSGTQDKERVGEAGYFVEGMMWGGIITFALPFRSYGKKEPVPGLYQRQTTSLYSSRPWNDVALVLRQTGDYADLGREHIPVKALAKRLAPGTIIETFAADELVPLYVLQRKSEGGKLGWTFEDPTATEDDTRARKRRKISYKERSEPGLIPNHIDVLYATTEHVPVDSGEFSVVEEDGL